MHGIILALLACGAVSAPGEFKAGVARKVITPTESIWMSGYAARTAPRRAFCTISGPRPWRWKTPGANAS